MSEQPFGLTAEDLKSVASVWDVVKKDLPGHGVTLFLNYFRFSPESLRFFRFKSTDLVELAKDRRLRFHASRVMNEINYFVENITDEAAILLSLTENASNHKKRSIPASAYDELKFALLYTFEDLLGTEKFNSHARSSWDKVLSTLFKVITNANQ